MKVAIINQRYGAEVNGGSELYTRQIAEHLAARHEVEILTSCSVDYVTWANYYEEGSFVEEGVRIRRFPTLHERIPRVFTPLDEEMHRNYDVTQEQADIWIEQMGPYCPGLIEYVKEHKEDYDVFIVVTYLYYPAVRALPEIGDKAIFIPTAHQEPYIHFKMYREVFRSAAAYIFLTEEEKRLVQSLFSVGEVPCDVMGVGVEVPEVVDGEAFRKKYGLEDYIVYVGRIDQGKDCPRMFQYFLEYKKRNKNRLKLVCMGKAVMEIPKSPDIICLGFVSDEDKFNGIMGSKALLLPSKFESLSISVLEAMSLSKPVIVNGICEVLKGHCVRSNGGLYYKDYFEFEGCMNYMLTHEEAWERMGQAALKYVESYYRWDVIMEKFDRMLERCAKIDK